MQRPHVLIWRDFRESAKKCSLMPLRGREGIEIRRYASDRRCDGTGRILLHPDGAELTAGDRGKGLLLLDSSWTRLPKLLERVEGEPVRRSLPRLVTAYPREGKIVKNPEGGLASVEALFAALCVLGFRDESLLDQYHFAEEFLRLNPWLREYS